jgi:hypothetical protein
MSHQAHWGDEIVILAISLMFDLKIVVVNAAALNSIPFRSSGNLQAADVVLLYNGETHYSKLGNYASFILFGCFA